MNTVLRISITVLLAAVWLLASTGASAQTPAKPQQFVYVLRVTPAFHDASQWTKTQNDALGRHFARLSQATQAGKVIFAGKTSEPLNSTFGLVVFEAESENAARQFMESDPAVEAGVMSATLHPYAIALQRKP